VFSVKDEPVRVKAMFAVLLLLLLGYHASRWLSELLARTVLKRLGLAPGRRAAWQALWFYSLFLLVLMVASSLFHLSLTQFSVVSGALAVGIGFGSQNLIGNLISGIILLVERPVNQGDVIEIDGRQVTVERVGPRSTIVRSMDNTHIIVPNSRLLEQPVTNWTLSDDVIRKRINVGLAYDSPTRKVEALIQRVLGSVEAVRKEPAPIVKFADFGESALVFEIYFWVGIADSWGAETELRHRIAENFAAEKIVMAYPQRDVHLATSTPLQVVVVTAPAESGGTAPRAQD
jgi:small-conductance mechanosensitive channel